MPILDFRPHKISYLVRSKGYEDENGDYHAGESKWVSCGKCDAVPNGKEESVVYDDGVVGKYTYTLYLSTRCREFKKGERVRIEFYSSSKVLEFDVLGFHRFQHHCRLWV